jgi:ABC-2 type transport system ATP-binding protein
VVIGRGRLLADVPMTSLLAGSGSAVVLRSTELPRLLPALDRAGGEVLTISGDRAELRGIDNVAVAEAALRLGVTVHELYRKERTLEQAFMELTHDERQFTGALDNRQEVLS